MSSQQSAQSSSSADTGVRRDCTKPRAATVDRSSGVGSAEHHGYPERQPGIGYGRSSGYISRDADKCVGRYAKSAGPALFRFH